MQAVTPADLATFLGAEFDETTDTPRAQMILDGVIAQALTVVTVGTVLETGPTVANLPDGALTVILGAAGRQFLNVRGATQQVSGSESVAGPATSGSMLSKAERRFLRAMAGYGGGVFGVDLLAASGFSTLGES